MSDDRTDPKPFLVLDSEEYDLLKFLIDLGLRDKDQVKNGTIANHLWHCLHFAKIYLQTLETKKE